MTRERALELANDCLWNPARLREKTLTDCTADTILAAVAEKREDCAKIADTYAAEMRGFTEEEFSAEEIARRIRLQP